MKNIGMKRLVALFAAMVILLVNPICAQAASGTYQILRAVPNHESALMNIRLRVSADFSNTDFEQNAAISLSGVPVLMQSGSLRADAAIGYILVIDRSGYYTAYLRYDDVKSVALQIIQSMNPNDRVAVVFADSNVETNSSFMLPSAAATLINGSVSSQPAGNNMPTPAMLYQGIQTAQQLSSATAADIPEQKAIIVLSDFAADDPDQTRNTVFQQFDPSVPLLTVPFWCSDYRTGQQLRQQAMDAAERGRSELLGLSSFNAEMVVPYDGEFDASQTATITNGLKETMRFVSFNVNIAPLFGRGVPTNDHELRVNYNGMESTLIVPLTPSAIATPIPVAATPTPTPDPNPVVLQFGDENATVLQLQQILKELYYYEGELNRKYDTAVQIALMDFCEVNNFVFSDVLRQDVWNFLLSGQAQPKATPTPAPSATPEPTPNPDIFLKIGDKSSTVYDLKTKLVRLGYLADEDLSMEFDETTQVALYRFCEINGLELRDGLTLAMWNLLQSGTAVANPTATPEPTVFITPEPTRDPAVKFIAGDQNGGVRALQNYLISHYYLDAQNRTGVFDSSTQWAVDDFCAVNGLPPMDDGMSLEAWMLLESGMAKANPTTVPTTNTPVPTRNPLFKFVLGDSNDQVIVLQRRLSQTYYLEETDISGVFDQKTLIAVVAFCDVNGLEFSADDSAANGMTNEAWTLLMSGNPLANPTATPEPTAEPTATPAPTSTPEPEFLALKPGDSNSYVLKFQQRLVELGYLKDEFTAGSYDDATQVAQDTLCEYNNLTMQIGADVEIQQFVFSPSIKNLASLGFMGQLRLIMEKTFSVAGVEIPVWILACVGLAIFLIAIIILLCVPGKKRRGAQSDGKASSGKDKSVLLAEETPATEDIDFNLSADVPTSENVNDWHIVLTITYMGNSQDYNYVLADGVPLRIGRRSGSDVLLNAADTTASRDHGTLVYHGNKLYYNDTSKKGSIVDGEPLHMGEREVKAGSTIEISRHSIRVSL